jgi:predicted solute-binding protein
MQARIGKSDRFWPGFAARYAREKNTPVETVEQYLTGRLQTEFSHAQREGLEDFFDLAMREGVLDEPRPVKYFRP